MDAVNTPTLFDQGVLEPAARTTDPSTSHRAARMASRNARTLRVACLDALKAAGDDGLTDFELADIVGRQQTSAGKRRGELVTMGLAEATSGRREAPSGAPATVWRATPAAYRT